MVNEYAAVWQSNRRQLSDSWRKLGAALALLLMTRPFQSLLVVGGVDVQLLLIALVVLIMAVSIRGQISRLIWFLTRDPLLLLLIGLVPLSLLWSAAPTRSLLGLLNFGAGTFVGVYLAMRFSLREQLQIVGLALAIAAVTSLVVGALSPTFGRMSVAEGGLAWRGIYDHKNSLGRYMAVFGTAAWALTLDGKRRGMWGLFLLLAALLIVLAKSATPLLALLLVIGASPLLGVVRWRDAGIRLIGLLLLALIAWGIVVFFIHPGLSRFGDYGLELLGRNPDRNSLQIRLGLWDYAWSYIARRPILGYGFDAFWSLPGRQPHITYIGTVWEVQQAHNGFIELWLQLGAIGLGGMILHLLTNFRRVLQSASLLSTAEYLWAVGYIIVLAVMNTSYSALLGQLAVPWSLYVAITLSVCARLSHQRTTLTKYEV